MKTALPFGVLLITMMTALSLSACSSNAIGAAANVSQETPTVPPPPYVEFTLQTIINDGGLAYIGMGGEIDGVINPDLVVQPGDAVRLILVNGDGMLHDLFLPDFDAKTSGISKINERTEIIFEVGDMQPGVYVYYCTVSGHRQAGQEGKLIVEQLSE
jgi:nitrite reductase (NO-forming)